MLTGSSISAGSGGIVATAILMNPSSSSTGIELSGEDDSEAKASPVSKGTVATTHWMVSSEGELEIASGEKNAKSQAVHGLGRRARQKLDRR
jgi:hypothetical protein